MQNYEKYMKRCFELALKADGKTSPNPMVGCVILDKYGNVAGEGYHHKAGMPHAEVEALKVAGDKAIGGTLIVSLEPCSHFGKTPPCADLIIKKGIKKLVVATKDCNPLVAGKGLEKCKNAGIEIVQDVLKQDALKLNEVFIKNMTENKIFVALKTATTLDGKIATKTGSSKWITSENSRNEVQKIRNRYDAILTTSSTVIKDNPSMTCRLENGKNPVKIVLDRELKTDLSSKIYSDTSSKMYLVTDNEIDNDRIATLPPHIEVIKCPTYNCKLDLSYIFDKLYEKGIRSVLIEAGGKLNGEAVSKGLVDKVYHFIAPKILGDETGKNAFEGRNIEKINNSLEFKIERIVDCYPDIMVVYY